MNKRLILLIPLLFLSGCFGSRQASLTSEPSIERAMDIIGSTQQGAALLKFLSKNPVRFEYANSAGLCHKFSLKTGTIFIPLEYKESDLVLALTMARAAHIYRLYTLSGLDEIVSEEEELGALFQARLAVETGLVNADFEKTRVASELKKDFCTYVLEGAAYAMQQARRKALLPDPDCQRPLDTLENQRVWLEKTHQAINDETFYLLLYERDMARVRKGVMPMSEAMKNDALVRAMPIYEIYRFQRNFYDKQSDIFTRFAIVYSGEVREDAAWRAAHQEDINRVREEFSDCNLP
ncbi:MAG: hypothetical protein Q7R35_19600 [Elusimicrobiota bacterium]|nr:hypothetical protein [Elusimicrobiota bacterium]